MGGIDNDVVYGTNLDFSGAAQVAAQMTVDGQLLIGATGAQPNTATLTAQYGTNITNAANAISIRSTVVTAYVVDPVAGNAPYTTVQAAITAAEATGNPEVVFIRSGTFTENLIFTTGTLSFVGSGEQNTTIIGTHTPPASGVLNIWRMTLQSATDTFYSLAAGTTDIIIEDVTSAVTNGYTFNLPNWTGSIASFDIGSIGTDNGYINNMGGAACFVFAAGIGNGTANPMIVSGTTLITTSDVTCPITFHGGGTTTLNNALFLQPVTTAGTNTVNCRNSSIDGGTSSAITHNSASVFTLSDVVVTSSAVDAIAGTGTIEFGSVTFPTSNGIAGTITGNYTTALETGTAFLQNISFDRGTNTVDTDGELIIGSTGNNPQIATLTAGTGITVTNAPGAITIDSVGGGITWNEVTDATVAMAVHNGYIANRGGGVTATLPAIAAVGEVVRIAGKLGNWVLAQNAGQTVHFGNQDTTAGAGGSLTATDASDCVKLLCTTADTNFTVIASIGNIGIT